MKRPNSKVNLDAAILRLAGTKTQGLRFSAIRAVIADVVIGQMLPDCVIKGGSSLKLRYGEGQTRFTLDFDTASRMELDAFIREMRRSLAEGWNDFTGTMDMERLKELQKLMDSEDCDLLDVLEYVAFEVPMQKRAERAGAARKGLSQWVQDEHAKGFYTFVLDNYVQEGVDVFTRDDALSQLIVTKYHTIDDARSTLGNLAVIRTGFATLQRAVYAA